MNDDVSQLSIIIKQGSVFAKLKAIKQLVKIGDGAAIELINEATEDRNFLVRRKAKRSLQKLKSMKEKQIHQRFIPKITEEPERYEEYIEKVEKPWNVRRDELLKLAKDGNRNIDKILMYLEDSNPVVRWRAAEVLKDVDTKQYYKALLYLSKDECIDVRREVIKALEPVLKSVDNKKEKTRYCPNCKKRVMPEVFSLPDYKYLDSDYIYYFCPYCHYKFLSYPWVSQ